MRIDLTPTTTSGLDRSQGSQPAAVRGSQDMLKQLGESAADVADLSTGSDAVQNLKARLAEVPDVRHEQVNSLRQAINAGSYQLSSQAIAEAMLSRS